MEIGKIKEKQPAKTALKEKAKAVPKELMRRGLDNGAERLRTQMRDAAQDGRQDESGGDRLEDAAAGAVRSGKNRAVRKLERIRRKRRRASGDPKREEKKEPEKKDAEGTPETQVDAASPKGDAAPHPDVRQEPYPDIRQRPAPDVHQEPYPALPGSRREQADVREKPSFQERASTHSGPSERTDAPRSNPERPAIKTKESCLRQQAAKASRTTPRRDSVQDSQTQAVDRRRTAGAAAEKRVVSSAAPAVETPPPAKQNVQQAPGTAGMRPDAAASPKAVAKGADLGQTAEGVHQASSIQRFPRVRVGQSSPAAQSSPTVQPSPAVRGSTVVWGSPSGIPNGQTERPGNRVPQAPERMGRLSSKTRAKARSGIKTAERTAGTLSKGAPPFRQAAQAPVGTARKMARAVQAIPKKQAAASAKAAAKTAVSTAKAAIAAIRNLVAALLAGGWMVLIVVIFLCLVGLLISSPFGIFFSGEDVNGDGRTMRVVMLEINAEFSQKISEIEAANPHDELDVGGTTVNWRDVLAIYTVKFSTGSEAPMELVTLTPEKEAYLREVFWDMNVISYEMDTVTSTTESGSTDIRVLRIRVTGKTQAEIAADYGFTPEQMEQLASLMDSQLDGAWRHLLYGTSGGSTDIVEAALSQVGSGNNGGEKFWSWYGFSSREEWCACFVSWCANECGYLESGLIPRFASCTAGMDWFDVRGQWMDNTYLPQPGDIIFFDWDLSGNADHVGIVERAEGGMVYTVEGNSGDAVRQNIYAHDNPQIRGYGLPQYP